MDAEVATVGDNCIDRYLPPVSLSFVGGNAVNVAAQFSRLGLRAAYFGAVGDDADGARVAGTLAGCGGGLLRRRDPGGPDRLHRDRPGAGRGAHHRLRGVRRLPRLAGRPMRCSNACAACATCMWAGSTTAAPRGGRWRRPACPLSQDIAVNPGAEGLAIAFASAGDGRGEAEAIGRSLLNEGAALAVVTMGRGGAVALGGGEAAWVPARPVSVLDTLGAGDSFAAGFVAARLRGAPLGECLDAGGRRGRCGLCALGRLPADRSIPPDKKKPARVGRAGEGREEGNASNDRECPVIEPASL